MKGIITFLGLAISAGFCAVSLAGTEQYSGKEMKQPVAPPCEEFYGDQEWDVSVWGTYAFTGTESSRTPIGAANDLQDFGSYDRFLGDDHAWGGGVDAKYFFHRYFGVGLEGFALAGRGSHAVFDPPAPAAFYEPNDHLVGAALGTITLRYPFHCARFSPYVWAGGGGIFNGSNDRTGVQSSDGVPFSVSKLDKEDRAMGQFGGGLEYRLTRHIGIIGDFSWNVVDGPHNNFGMARSGLNFAF